MADIIPSVVDGLKEYERLALFWALELFSDGEGLDVGELAMATFRSAQNYSVQIREDAIVRFAQNFIGTNNINLFEPLGDFGNRYKGPLEFGGNTVGLEIGINPITRLIFVEEDDSMAMQELEGCSMCGKSPIWLIPIIPFILVNGCDGKGSWLKSCIPKYKPEDIIANIRLYLQGKEMVPMIPWYKGFEGKVELSPTDDTQYIITGVIAKIDSRRRTVTITELPIGLWTHTYMTWLDGQRWIESVKDLSEFKGTIHLKVTLSDDIWLADEEYLMMTLRLIRTISINDLYAIDPCGDVVKYENPLEIIMDFAGYRSAFYHRRKDVMLANIKSELTSVESDIQGSIQVAVRSSNVIKQWMPKLKESPETVKLSNLLGFLYEEIEVLHTVDLVNREMENGVVTLFGIAVTLWESRGTCGRGGLYADDFQALETVCNALKKLKVAVSEIRELCSKRNDLKGRLHRLQSEDCMSLWLKDLDQLELFLKGQWEKDEESLSEKREASAQRSRGWKRKAGFSF